MLGYVVRRLLMAVPVMGVVAVIVFSLLYLTPGDPAQVLAGDTATPEQIDESAPPSGSTSRRTCASWPGCGRSCAATSAPRSSAASRWPT